MAAKEVIKYFEYFVSIFHPIEHIIETKHEHNTYAPRFAVLNQIPAKRTVFYLTVDLV